MSHCPEALARTLGRIAGAWLMLAGLSTLALAQGVTGTVSGTVRDSQGGVIPGATVTLISEARNTRLAPVVTSTQGDFVFPNITADTYTLQIEMPSFRTLRRPGVDVSSGSIVALGSDHDRSRRHAEVVTSSPRRRSCRPPAANDRSQ